MADQPNGCDVENPESRAAAALQRLQSSRRVRLLYLKALENLEEQLDQTWQRIFPTERPIPRGSCEDFFDSFVHFGGALYDAYADALIAARMPEAQYMQVLNNDLKTLVCNQIYPYRKEPIRSLQDALAADARGERPGEWTVRMAEAWRRFEHPMHSKADGQVQREFIDIYWYMPVLWEKLIKRIHKAISKRTTHWAAVHAERGASPLFERVAPDDPNYDLVRRNSLQGWAASWGFQTELFAGRATLEHFIATNIATVTQWVRVHVEFQDAAPISQKIKEIDNVVEGSIGIFSEALAPEMERLGKDLVDSAIERFSNKAREISARAKKSLLDAELRREEKHSNNSINASQSLDSSGNDSSTVFREVPASITNTASRRESDRWREWKANWSAAGRCDSSDPTGMEPTRATQAHR